MDRLGLKEGEVITHSMVSKSIERAQKKIESRNFSMRKNLIEYDDVMNNQRSVVYDRRTQALGGESVRNEIKNILNDYLDFIINIESNNLDSARFKSDIMETLSIDCNSIDINSDYKKIKKYILDESDKILDMKSEMVGEEIFEQFQKFVIFRTIDQKWKEHLYSMDQLREGINLRAYGQKNPLVEYKQEGYQMFTEMMIDTNQETLKRIFRSNIAAPDDSQIRRVPKNVNLSHDKMPIDFATPPPQATMQNLAKGAPHQKRGHQSVKPIQSSKKYGRNDKVKISKGSETKFIKYKKAEPLINEGWTIVE